MEIKLETFEVKSGKNKGKSFPMILFMNDSKFPHRVSLSKAKLVIENLEAIKMVMAQGGL